jgi:octaprenyl-diphosphate synthase
MSSILAQVSNIIKSDITQFRLVFQQSLDSDVKLINTVIGYISKKKGKQIRPTLTLLSARMCGEPTEMTYRSAALIEILHVATLIHDDVVDEADIRRGIPTINRIWKNKISILVGDYMFSKSLSNMIYLKDFKALQILTDTAQRLSQGEILQIEKAIKKDITEEIYYRMISDKTASLISAACELGAITTTDDNEKHLAMKRFGEKLGVAFQLKDDLLDIVGNVKGTGKPSGFDVKKNMMTLPLIHILSNCEKTEKQEIIRKLKRHAKRSDLSSVRKLIEEKGGVDYTKSEIHRISLSARTDLEIFDDSDYKSALFKILDFNVNRSY